MTDNDGRAESSVLLLLLLPGIVHLLRFHHNQPLHLNHHKIVDFLKGKEDEERRERERKEERERESTWLSIPRREGVVR